MAMTILWKDGQSQIVPWAIDYRRYNDPARNKFYQSPPELEHRA